jgi:hypothetical protein
MNDWEKILSKKYGKYYLYNTQTGQSMWPSKLRGGAEEDDSDSDLGIDTDPVADPVADIQQQLDAMTLTRLARKKREVDFEIEGGTPPKDRRVTDGQQDRMTGLFGRVSSPRNVLPRAPLVKLPFKSPPSAYQRASLQKMTDQLRREEEKANRMQIDQPPIFRHALQPPQQPVSSINIPRRNLQTPPLSDEEFAILMTGQDPRPSQSRTFRQYLEEIGRGSIRTDPPVRSHQPVIPPRRPALYKRK